MEWRFFTRHHANTLSHIHSHYTEEQLSTLSPPSGMLWGGGRKLVWTGENKKNSIQQKLVIPKWMKLQEEHHDGPGRSRESFRIRQQEQHVAQQTDRERNNTMFLFYSSIKGVTLACLSLWVLNMSNILHLGSHNWTVSRSDGLLRRPNKNRDTFAINSKPTRIPSSTARALQQCLVAYSCLKATASAIPNWQQSKDSNSTTRSY